MSLEEAIDRVQRVYDRDRLHAAPTDVVAQHLGYKGANNGTALAALASVRYFGLVDRPREGFLAVTKDFEHFKFAPDDRQRRELMTGFLRKPSLYAELLEKYASGLPSDANLRFELIQRGFSPVAAEAALVAFRRSVDYVDYFAQDDTTIVSPVEGVDEAEVVESPTGDYKAAQRALLASSVSAADSFGPRVDVSEDLDRIPVRLPGGRRAWLFIPSPFFSGDKARLKAQIDLLLTADEEEQL